MLADGKAWAGRTRLPKNGGTVDGRPCSDELARSSLGPMGQVSTRTSLETTKVDCR